MARGIHPEAYRALFDYCADGILFTCADSGHILAANPAACQMLGHSEDAPCRLGRDGIVAPANRPRWAAAVAEGTRTGLTKGQRADPPVL